MLDTIRALRHPGPPRPCLRHGLPSFARRRIPLLETGAANFDSCEKCDPHMSAETPNRLLVHICTESSERSTNVLRPPIAHFALRFRLDFLKTLTPAASYPIR